MVDGPAHPLYVGILVHEPVGHIHRAARDITEAKVQGSFRGKLLVVLRGYVDD